MSYPTCSEFKKSSGTDGKVGETLKHLQDGATGANGECVLLAVTLPVPNCTL